MCFIGIVGPIGFVFKRRRLELHLSLAFGIIVFQYPPDHLDPRSFA